MRFNRWQQNTLFAITAVLVLDCTFIIVQAFSMHNFSNEELLFLGAGQGGIIGVAYIFAKAGNKEDASNGKNQQEDKKP